MTFLDLFLFLLSLSRDLDLFLSLDLDRGLFELWWAERSLDRDLFRSLLDFLSSLSPDLDLAHALIFLYSFSF